MKKQICNKKVLLLFLFLILYSKRNDLDILLGHKIKMVITKYSIRQKNAVISLGIKKDKLIYSIFLSGSIMKRL